MTYRPTLPPEDDRDFTQLTGAFDRPVAPSPAFAERLKQRVVDAQHEQGASDMHAHAAQEPRVSRMTDRRVIPMPPQRSGGSFMELVAAAVLIFALVSSGFYMYRIQNGTTPTEPDGQRLAATTPLASPTPVSDASDPAWTDPGRTNAFPAGFDPGTAQPGEPLVEVPFATDYGLVSNNALIIAGMPVEEAEGEQPGMPVLSVIDLPTGDVRWSAPFAFSGPFITDDNTLYAQEMTEFKEGQSINLFAISLETGERLWTHEMQQFNDSDNSGLDVVSPLRPLSFGMPIAIDGNLYVARSTGDVLALDGATGEVLWETAGETDVALEDALGGSLVGDDTHLYVVDGENAIVKLDRETGEIIDRLAVNYRPSPQFVLDLYLQNDRLVLTAKDPMPHEYDSVLVDVLATDSGDILWNASIGPLAGSLVITDTILGLPVSYPPDSEASPESSQGPNVIRFFNLETGEHLTNLGSSHWRGASASASGSVICLHGTTSAFICVDTDNQETGPYSIDTGAAYFAEGPPSPVLFWNGNAIVLGHEGGPHIIRSGSTTSEATPEASPVSSPASPVPEESPMWIDPGNTNAYPAGFDSTITQPVEPLGDIDFNSNSGIIVGDTLILTGLPGNYDPEDAPIDPTVTGIDLTTGDQIWSEQRGIMGVPVAGQDAFYTVEMTEPVDDSFTVKLVSVSPATGATNWEYTLFDLPETAFGSNSLTSLTSRPIAVGDHVYIADGLGEITAFDAASGEIVWQQAEVEYFSEYRAAPFGSLVGGEDHLFVVNYMYEIAQYDAGTGEIVDTFSLEHDPHTNEQLHLRLTGDRLVVIAQHPNHPPLLEVLDSESGDSLWSTDLGGYPAGSMVLTDTVVGIPQHYSDDATPATANNSFRFVVESYDLNTGELVDDYSPAPVQGASLSASGSVVCIHESAPAISCDDMADFEFEPTAIDIGSGVPAEGPPSPVLFWNGNAIVLGHEGGPHIVRSANASSDAMPEPSTFWLDPNHTRAWPAGFNLTGPLVAQPLDGYQGYAASGVVVGDVLIAENKALTMDDPPTFSGTGIYAQDLQTGEILWRNTEQIYERYTVDESGVYILPQPVTNQQYLIALDLETGEERWRSEPLSDFSSYPEDAPFLHALNPLAIDGFVYVPFVDGTVLAFDGASGDIAWHYTPDDIAGIDDVHGHASVAGRSDRIYAASGANVISVLDRESGDLIREIRVDDVPVDDYRIDVVAGGGHLLVQASSTANGETGGKLIVVEPETGEERWRQDTNVMVSNVLMSPTTIGVMHVEYDPANLIERVVFDDELGGTTELSLFDITTGEPIEVPEGVFSPIEGVWSGALAASGETICVAYTTVTCFEPDGQVATVEGFETDDVSAPQGLVFWGDRVVILDAREPIHIVTGP